MKTVQVFDHINNEKSMRLMRRLYRELLHNDNNFHFFFEPSLIIRTSLYRECIKLLPYKNKCRVYDYPYPKKSNKLFYIRYGEDKKYSRYQKQLEQLYHWQSVIALTVKNKSSQQFILNRTHHCLLNMFGFKHYNESLYYLRQATGYMPHKLSKTLLKIIYKLFSY